MTDALALHNSAWMVKHDTAVVSVPTLTEAQVVIDRMIAIGAVYSPDFSFIAVLVPYRQAYWALEALEDPAGVKAITGRDPGVDRVMKGKMCARGARFLVIASVVAAPAFAQEDPTSRRAGVVDVPLVERSRVFKNIPDDETGEIYEAFLALHFSVGGSMQDSYDEAKLTKKPDWAILPTVSMIVNLRQLHADSAPVRTPSYMPRVRVTAVRTKPPVNKETTGQWVFDGTFGHYSNGQEGCTFQQQNRGQDCAFPSPISDDDLIENGLDGSFSSHYLEGAAAHRWITWSDQLLPNGRLPNTRLMTAFVRVRDYESLSGLGGGMSDDLKRLYGSLRIRAGGEVVFENDVDEVGPLHGAQWFGAWIEHSNGHARVGAWRGAVEYGKTFDKLNGTGLFVRGYFGHDDYNIAFLRKINVLQIGVALGGERRPTFRP